MPNISLTLNAFLEDLNENAANYTQKNSPFAQENFESFRDTIQFKCIDKEDDLSYLYSDLLELQKTCSEFKIIPAVNDLFIFLGQEIALRAALANTVMDFVASMLIFPHPEWVALDAIDKTVLSVCCKAFKTDNLILYFQDNQHRSSPVISLLSDSNLIPTHMFTYLLSKIERRLESQKEDFSHTRQSSPRALFNQAAEYERVGDRIEIRPSRSPSNSPREYQPQTSPRKYSPRVHSSKGVQVGNHIEMTPINISPRSSTDQMQISPRYILNDPPRNQRVLPKRVHRTSHSPRSSKEQNELYNALLLNQQTLNHFSTPSDEHTLTSTFFSLRNNAQAQVKEKKSENKFPPLDFSKLRITEENQEKVTSHIKRELK